jgi:hypothetical protein
MPLNELRTVTGNIAIFLHLLFLIANDNQSILTVATMLVILNKCHIGFQYKVLHLASCVAGCNMNINMIVVGMIHSQL